jgi:hypothetical protein
LQCSCLPPSMAHCVARSGTQPRSVSRTSLLSSVSLTVFSVKRFEFSMGCCWFHDVYEGLTALPAVANLTGRSCSPWNVGRREDEVIVRLVFCF